MSFHDNDDIHAHMVYTDVVEETMEQGLIGMQTQQIEYNYDDHTMIMVNPLQPKDPNHAPQQVHNTTANVIMDKQVMDDNKEDDIDNDNNEEDKIDNSNN
eukprot:4166575-Ditylum_brightwellii.AAC.1